ncbi:prepilin-type N-terminal cleavage/methylation domain-containing protein [Candidatus Saccharibacteria bacterium]|nr:prepilin-type N-terminal cleavage/methylation domain-containing protein [Candidatus Saccharibacteria bacterium]
MRKSPGFTIIELLVVVVLFLSMCGLFLYQKNNIEAAGRDDRRKADINTLYHNLEKVYYVEHKSYPDALNTKTLPAVQSDTFKDPAGIAINELQIDDLLGTTTRSTYTYEPIDCKNSQCKGYTLRADLEKEADYIRNSVQGSKK